MIWLCLLVHRFPRWADIKLDVYHKGSEKPVNEDWQERRCMRCNLRVQRKV